MRDEAQKNSAKPKGQYDVARIPPKMLRGQLVPERFELDGVAYTLEKHLKADFFAATGRYADPEGRRVCLKHFHTESWIGMPLGWAGRHMCNREIGFYRLLDGVAGIPRLVGKLGQSGLVHQWIDGCDLLDVTGKVADDFFDRLEQLTLELHRRGVAYVDLNKPDNVLVGDDGRPYLVDFQISYRCPQSRWRVFGQSLFSQLCHEDLYHVRKLKRKFRRDLMTPEELAASYERSWVLSVHRKFAHPFQQVRRWVLTRLGAR
jgi:RIO-like serine/threonine protein kinase